MSYIYSNSSTKLEEQIRAHYQLGYKVMKSPGFFKSTLPRGLLDIDLLKKLVQSRSRGTLYRETKEMKAWHCCLLKLSSTPGESVDPDPGRTAQINQLIIEIEQAPKVSMRGNAVI